MPGPELTRRDVDGRPNGLILMLHGGKADSLTPVDGKNASWRRSNAMMSHISGRANRVGASIWLLRHQQAGWNERDASPPSPVPDARWALAEARRELSDLPVVLLGHSMGGRTAVAVADEPHVTGVVALAPWLPADESAQTLAGKQFAAAHGRSDKITSCRETQAFVRRAESVASSTEFKDMGRVGHFMIRRISTWNDFAITRSLAILSEHANP
ncbi:MAG: alpha/beta fold hydrolase [Actinomycetales bacterium]|nr:alpha/beta fold hydrolase [Actinomycetales bacterium]